VLGRPTFLTIPAFGPRLLLGSEMANALLFGSARVQPTQLEASGYDFTHPTLEVGLQSMLGV
jgi:NAD dependent epimerase/dehydratase family enzyme